MANEFSFGPNPQYAFGGSGGIMGRALLLGLTNGLSLMDMFDQFRRHNETTPGWIAAQNAQNGALQSRSNLQSAQDQNGLGWQLGQMGANPADFGYGLHSLTGYGAFGPLHPSAAPAIPSSSAPLAYPSAPAYNPPQTQNYSPDYGGASDFNPITPWGNGGW